MEHFLQSGKLSVYVTWTLREIAYLSSGCFARDRDRRSDFLPMAFALAVGFRTYLN